MAPSEFKEAFRKLVVYAKVIYRIVIKKEHCICLFYSEVKNKRGHLNIDDFHSAGWSNKQVDTLIPAFFKIASAHYHRERQKQVVNEFKEILKCKKTKKMKLQSSAA